MHKFSEIQLGGGSRVGDEWKEGIRRAVQAVARQRVQLIPVDTLKDAYQAMIGKSR